MGEPSEAVYITPRRKQAYVSGDPKFVSRVLKFGASCVRCHTKRIKCLGGVPCRNCALSSSPCIFAPPRRSRTSPVLLPPILPAPTVGEHASTAGLVASTPSNTVPGHYRRTEKDFASSRSSNDPRDARPNYRGNPSCQSFIEQFTAWVAYLNAELIKNNDNSFDPPWGDLGSIVHYISEPSLEISIDTTIQEPAPRAQNVKPVTIRLPPYNHSIHLIQVLESAIGHEQHYFRRRDLRAKVWQMHQNPESAHSKDQGWLCHWLAVVALGELYNGVSIAGGDLVPPGSDYYHQSVALLQQVAEKPDIQYIATLCLLCLYAFSMNLTNTAYMYVGISLRAALALNLHRDPAEYQSGQSDLREVELEHQKRLFWTVYYQDLLTTTTTGRPWGVLDDEITVGYGSSASQSSDILLEFFDADEGNEHLELMRLRSQAYSSLYGYAGTAINPHSHICLYDYDLGSPLTSQHLDKMTEFCESLVAWESELSASLKISRNWDGSMVNLNRVNANMYLIYHQSILVILRPALVNIFDDCFDPKARASNAFSIGSLNGAAPMTGRLTAMYNHSLESARQSIDILQWLFEKGALPTYCYFHANYLFTTAITLYIAKAMTSRERLGIRFTNEDHAALATALRLLSDQSTAKSVPAVEFCRKLEMLDRNLQALTLHIQDTYRGDIFDLLSSSVSND